MIRKVKFIFITVAVLFASFFAYQSLTPRRSVIKCFARDGRVTISKVTYGTLIEFIPQTGSFAPDTNAAGRSVVKVNIDELYLSRVSKGLLATTTLNNVDYSLEIAEVYPEVTNGRFKIDLSFKDAIPKNINTRQSVRIRIQLSKPTTCVMLPVGGFYKDTGGRWVFVVKDGHAVRREIKLGKRNSATHEVVEGLNPGEEVITSSYENFIDKDIVDLRQLSDRKTVIRM